MFKTASLSHTFICSDFAADKHTSDSLRLTHHILRPFHIHPTLASSQTRGKTATFPKSPSPAFPQFVSATQQLAAALGFFRNPHWAAFCARHHPQAVFLPTASPPKPLLTAPHSRWRTLFPNPFPTSFLRQIWHPRRPIIKPPTAHMLTLKTSCGTFADITFTSTASFPQDMKSMAPGKITLC